MITEETFKRALEVSSLRFGGDGWFSDGYFAVRGEQWAAFGKEPRAIGTSINKWKTLPTVPVHEKPSLRIAPTTRWEMCDSCGGDSAHECDCGHSHVCEECHGDKRGVEMLDDVGQMVFEGAGGLTVVNPVYGALLEGLKIRRDATATCEAALAMILAFDDSGELVAVVMPLKSDIRYPKKADEAEVAP